MSDVGNALQPSQGVSVVALPKQNFTGNPLDRTSDARRRFSGIHGKEEEVSLLVVAGREVCVRTVTHGQQDLQALLLKMDDPEIDLKSETKCLRWCADDDTAYDLPLYLLGQDQSQRWTFAVDVTEARDHFVLFLRESCQLDVQMKDLRILLPGLPLDACAIAGQAVALSQWHQTHKFCHRCGGHTVSVESGMRRRCVKEASHKLYPRTDPVVIMLVESPDGNRALLGRGRKSTPGMYTCLSGFIDQCEGIEEAVRREVMEEARIAVQEVQIVGTQPWPIGRYGSCELMIGCVAKARSYEVFINPKEMEDVQWYDRGELMASVRMYEDNKGVPLQDIQKHSWNTLGFFIPPPFAIAHHLIKIWSESGEPWFQDGLVATPSAGAPALLTMGNGNGVSNNHGQASSEISSAM